jgi:hypothetical protein
MNNNPTAENMAKLLYKKITELFNPNAKGVKVNSVRVWETTTGSAICFGDYDVFDDFYYVSDFIDQKLVEDVVRGYYAENN